MEIGIVGSGAIGAHLARIFSTGGHDVAVANSRGPETIDPDVLESGAHAATAADAVQGKDVVILSVPYFKVPEVAGLFASVPEATVVIDTTNYAPFGAWNVPIDGLGQGQVESLWVAEQLGRPVVKAWNAVLEGTLKTKGVPAGTPGRIALPVAADSDKARRIAMQLVDESGFDPFDAGKLADSWRQQPATPAYCTELSLDELEPALRAANREQTPAVRDRLLKYLANLTSLPPLDDMVKINRSLYR